MGRDGPSPRDLEGFNFTFEWSDGDLQLCEELLSASEKEYLSKFSNWREKIRHAAEKETELGEYPCPGCGELMWVEEEPPCGGEQQPNQPQSMDKHSLQDIKDKME